MTQTQVSKTRPGATPPPAPTSDVLWNFHSETRYSWDMLRCTVLASGSKGNCTVVSTGSTRILLDAGLSCREIVKRMRLAGENPEKMDGLLITHEHSDHIQGVSVLARRWKVPVYFTEATHKAWARAITPRRTMSFSAWLETRKQETQKQETQKQQAATLALTAEADDETPETQNLTEAALEMSAPDVLETDSCDAADAASPADGLPELADLAANGSGSNPASNPASLPALEYFCAGVPFVIGDITVTPFTIPHDAADPVGFVVEAEGMRIAVATDLGYMPPNVQRQLQRADLLILESNHDVEMLRDGPYPWAVKQRVLSRVGHLSNDAASEFLANDYDGTARWVVLAHLSESNNLPELARLSAERALRGHSKAAGSQVVLATQNAPLESIYL